MGGALSARNGAGDPLLLTSRGDPDRARFGLDRWVTSRAQVSQNAEKYTLGRLDAAVNLGRWKVGVEKGRAWHRVRMMQLGRELSCSGPARPSTLATPTQGNGALQHSNQRQHRETHRPVRAAASLSTDRNGRLQGSSANSVKLEEEFQEARGGLASTSGNQHLAVLRATKSAAIPLREREKPLGMPLGHFCYQRDAFSDLLGS